MLYKKYHKDFVKQFKRRSKFKLYYKGKEIMCDVVVEPSINSAHIDIAVITQVTHPERISLISLVFSSGKLGIVNVKFIEDAV